MKYIFKEYTKENQGYEYPYKVYLEKEDGDDIDEIFEKGFLPSRIKKDFFYLSRNLRINLKDFDWNSENRRVLKKTENISIEKQSLKNFKWEYDIGLIAIEFFKEKFGQKIISTQKLKWLFSGEFFNSVFVFKKENEIIGYTICMETKNFLDYAYPFYKKEYIKENIGMGMMLKAIKHSLENEKKYVNLGTIYDKEAKYKLQFKNLEWWDGENWNRDITSLKEKIK